MTPRQRRMVWVSLIVTGEGLLLLDNILLVIACASVLLGTLYPLLMDALQLGKIPETFVIDKQGIIRYKHIGPITPKEWEEKIGPLVAYLEKQP